MLAKILLNQQLDIILLIYAESVLCVYELFRRAFLELTDQCLQMQRIAA